MKLMLTSFMNFVTGNCESGNFLVNPSEAEGAVMLALTLRMGNPSTFARDDEVGALRLRGGAFR